MKNKERILKSNGNRKRAREPDYPDGDECVVKWFKQARDKNIPLSGTFARAKVEEFAISLGNSSCKASSGWLNGFKERNGISFNSVCGESSSLNQGAAKEWKEKVVEIIEYTLDRDIFNIDATGLFFKCTAAKTLAFKGEKCSGGKHNKDRITLLVGANMDGTEKLLMIGKSRNPRCFKNVKSKHIEYHSNTKAWMTANIFEDWLLDLNRTYQRKNRKIILFIDNCTAHKSIPTMENITVDFFLPNMTSVVLPMDQGIIKNLKHFCRCLVVQHLLTESSQKLPITLLDASRMCLNA
ncbi:tigger transposable element-derived protein 4-like [Parasteatoda tepidariorum]|uniref:tigger transposable element-derived protein 4-like n=1 Tax=Parasteatoda tepidariorum TaxID=114398 RepID=UPI001C71AF51|nr:tigger transposable element-derived protein 4-like [Parasteatoda tepidariorum]